MHIHPLRDLDSESEHLLRIRAELRDRAPDESVEQVRTALATGRINAVSLVDDDGTAHGIAAWRWSDRTQTYAQVLFLYTPPEAPSEHSALLADHLVPILMAAPTLQVIEARLRDESPGVREAWQTHDFALFKRCRARRPLSKTTPLPIMPIPDGYRLAAWNDDHDSQAERVATAAYTAGIELVAVPHPPQTPAAALHSARTGSTWIAGASSVALDKRDHVVGYIAITHPTENTDSACILDLAIHPDHRKRGLARSLLIRGMRACGQQAIPAITVTFTLQNPARRIFDQLSFQPIDCGEIAIWWRDGRQLKWRE